MIANARRRYLGQIIEDKLVSEPLFPGDASPDFIVGQTMEGEKKIYMRGKINWLEQEAPESDKSALQDYRYIKIYR